MILARSIDLYGQRSYVYVTYRELYTLSTATLSLNPFELGSYRLCGLQNSTAVHCTEYIKDEPCMPKEARVMFHISSKPLYKPPSIHVYILRRVLRTVSDPCTGYVALPYKFHGELRNITAMR